MRETQGERSRDRDTPPPRGRETQGGGGSNSAARVVDEVIQGAALCQLHGDAEVLRLLVHVRGVVSGVGFKVQVSGLKDQG